MGQFSSKLFAKKENTEKICALIDHAAGEKVKVLVLPEYSELGMPMLADPKIKQRLLELAEVVPGPFSDVLLEKARQHDMHIFLTTYEKDAGLLFNCGLFACPDGKLIKYRKVHLYKTSVLDEKYYLQRGNDHIVVDTLAGSMGLLICYDSVMPESARILTLKGAQMILIPAAWPKGGQLRWERLIPARAVENQVFVLASGRSGDGFTGNSMIVDYQGEILQRLGNHEGVAVTEIDFSAQMRWRMEVLPYLSDRRPELYGNLSELDFGSVE